MKIALPKRAVHVLESPNIKFDAYDWKNETFWNYEYCLDNLYFIIIL